MTSQKRYRHQENSNSSARSRDLPPRFKRQKSASGQTPLASRPPSPPPSQLEPNTSSDDMTKLSTHQTQSPASCARPAYGNMHHNTLAYSDIPSNTVPQQTYGYPQSLPMWQVNSFPAQQQQVMLAPASMLVPTGPAMLFNNENCAPSPPYCMPPCGPVSPWNMSGYGSPYHSSCSSPAPTVPSPSPSGVARNCSPQPAEAAERIASSNLDAGYSDPDLRTIEMLRELERVADEKESQEATEGAGSDRKTLVSHHLRMIMCAMDLYTEGIEEGESTTSRGSDNVSSRHGSNMSSPSASPPPVKYTQHHARQPQGHPSKLQGQNHSWNNVKSEPLHHQPRPRPVLGAAANLKHPTMHHQPRSVVADAPRSFVPPTPMPVQPPQMPWMQYTQPPTPAQVSDWNPWSSPSFDFYGALGNPCADGSSQVFESFHDACFPVDKNGRKPLYKR